MSITVAKFGGTSLCDAQQFRKVRDIVLSDPSRRFIVASAPGKRFDTDEKITDLLLKCHAAAAVGDSFEAPFRQIRERFDEIITLGPVIMMKFVTLTAKPFSVPVTVSMNPIMIDGTGMCGGCRLTLIKDGKRVTRFACVDGPDFNGYEVDFDEAMSRGRMYAEFEKHAYEETCNLFKK